MVVNNCKKVKPPTDREFLVFKNGYWNFAHWATKKEENVPCSMFIDREGFDMTNFNLWCDLPIVKEPI